VRARASKGLARYSLTNQLLVVLQSEGRATFVAGFKQWLRLGYCVKKGERALRILAPMTVKERDRRTGEETGETKTFFPTVFVFFQEQVAPLPSGEPVPLEPPREPLTGDSHGHLLPPLQSFCESLGYSVSFEELDGPAGGWCDRRSKRIVVDARTPANARLRMLVHETGHALGVDYERYSREQSEVLADTVVFCPGRHEARLGRCAQRQLQALPTCLPAGAHLRGDDRTRSLLAASGARTQRRPRGLRVVQNGRVRLGSGYARMRATANRALRACGIAHRQVAACL
jgi:hypothetical protein